MRMELAREGLCELANEVWEPSACPLCVQGQALTLA